MPLLGNPRVTVASMLAMSHPLVMGIVNVTPDSFSGDGVLAHHDAQIAVAQAMQMVVDGADIIDIGGESTRPGHAPVTAADEIRRVVPVISALRTVCDVPISIDTTKAAVATAALDAGADIVNDVLALRGDPDMAGVVAGYQVPVILMHNRSAPQQVTEMSALGSSYVAPAYTDFLAEIQQDLRGSVAMAVAAGIQPTQIILDPGLGFGKTAEQNMQLIRYCDVLVALGYPLLLGASRKSFMGRLLDLPVKERGEATLTACVIGWQRGAKIFRVHDVRATRRALAMAQAILTA